jgi:hypothetical protein
MCCRKKKQSLENKEEKDGVAEPDASDGEMTCEDAVVELMSTMKFESSEATENFKNAELKKCKETK